MIADFLITFRETLEAALVVGIVLAYLSRTKQTRYNNVVYIGVAAGLVASVIGALNRYHNVSNMYPRGLVQLGDVIIMHPLEFRCCLNNFSVLSGSSMCSKVPFETITSNFSLILLTSIFLNSRFG